MKTAADSTVLQAVSHASVLIRGRDGMVLTDPWYLQSAFESWVPCPPPVISVDIWLALARTGALAIVLSHLHPDHTDPEFLRLLPKVTPIFVADFPDRHFVNYLQGLGFENVTEIGQDGAEFRGFKFHRLFSHMSHFDSCISIEAPDCFILHGNDAWDIGESNLRRLREIKPSGKPSLLMGQGASASGHPLTYFDKPWSERVELLKNKNVQMLKGLAAFGEKAGFDRWLAYACFTAIKVPGKDYSFKAPTATGPYANQVCGTDRFIDFSPGDVFIPAEDRVIPILRTLHVPMQYFRTLEAGPVLPAVSRVSWMEKYDAALTGFMSKLQKYFESQEPSRYLRQDLGLTLNFDIVFEGQADLLRRSVKVYGGESGRQKTCRVPSSQLAAVLERRIPFENLYSGYQAEWAREPASHYNRQFLNCLIEFGYAFQDGKAV